MSLKKDLKKLHFSKISVRKGSPFQVTTIGQKNSFWTDNGEKFIRMSFIKLSFFLNCFCAAAYSDVEFLIREMIALALFIFQPTWNIH